MPRGVPGSAVVKKPEPKCSFAMVLENWSSFLSIAESVSKSGRAGDNKTKEQALAVILQGAELGIPPMTAMRWLYPIEGGLTMSAPCAQALIYRDLPGSKFKITTTNQFCEVTIEIPGREPVTERYTIEDANIAGFNKPTRDGKKSGWQKFPKDHLFANAMRRACTRAAPDVTGGLLAPEEFGVQSAPVEVEQSKPSEPAGVIDTTATELAPAPASPMPTNEPNVSHPDPGAPVPSNGLVSNAQLLELKRLKDAIKFGNEEWLALLEPFKVGTVRLLKSNQATQLLDVLTKKQAATSPEIVGAAKN